MALMIKNYAEVIGMETMINYKIGERPAIKGIEEVHKELKPLFSTEKEYVIVLHIDSKNKVICREIVHIGTLNSCLIEPAAIFRNAIKLNANGIIIAHNHPTGSIEPSKEDIDIENKLRKAGNILKISVVDNVIFSDTDIKSIM